jgi:uncharacterized repeat protein (TIGR04076 family)
MERREFLSCAALTSAASLAVAQPAHAAAQQPPAQAAKRVRITVLRRSIQKEFQQYRKSEIVACDRVKDGQQFIVESPWEKPAGMCDWAWADIRTFIHIVRAGDLSEFVTCCTDGFRPVFFRIEKLV